MICRFYVIRVITKLEKYSYSNFPKYCIYLYYLILLFAPTLKIGDIVVMDNLSSHRVKGVIEAINMV